MTDVLDPLPAAPEPEADGRRSQARPALWVGLAVALVLALFIGVLATRAPAANQVAKSPLLGRPAPELRGIEGLDGAPVQLSSFRGRWVYVNFFNSWCVPCRQEHPELVRFAARHTGPQDPTLLGVIHDDDAATVRSYLAKEGGGWPVVDDPRGQTALDFGVRGQPETFLIDPQGVVVSRVISSVTADGLDALLARAQASEA